MRITVPLVVLAWAPSCQSASNPRTVAAMLSLGFLLLSATFAQSPSSLTRPSRPQVLQPTMGTRYGAKSVERLLVTLDTTQGLFEYYAHGPVIVSVDARGETSLVKLSIVSSQTRAFPLRHQFEGEESARVVSSGVAQAWLEHQYPNHTARESTISSQRAEDGSVVIPVTIHYSFAAGDLVVSTSSLRRQAADPVRGTSEAYSRSVTELHGQLRCSFEGSDSVNPVMACAPLDLVVAAKHLSEGPQQTFIQRATITFPGALQKIPAELLAVVDNLNYCYRYHRIRLGGTWGECPSFSNSDTAWGKCCFSMIGYAGADFVWPNSTVTTAPTTWDAHYTTLHEDSQDEGLETGCAEMMTVFCVPSIAGGLEGKAFVTSGLVLVKDGTNQNKIIAHEIGHTLDLLHEDVVCTVDKDVAAATGSNYNTPSDICDWARLSSRAYYGGGTCTTDPTNCS